MDEPLDLVNLLKVPRGPAVLGNCVDERHARVGVEVANLEAEFRHGDVAHELVMPELDHALD